MEKKNQTVVNEYNPENRATYRDQVVRNVQTDYDKCAYGVWQGKLVMSFHIENGTWYVYPHYINVPEFLASFEKGA